MQPLLTIDAQTEDTALTIAEQQIHALAHPGQAINLISQALDFIVEVGPNADAVGAIQDGTQQLLDTIAALDTAFKNTMVAAKTLRDQRRVALESLGELKQAIKNQDRRVPEIDDMLDEVYQEAHEEAYETTADIFQEELIDDIIQSTPLEWDEACMLLDILQGAYSRIKMDDPLWQDLRDLIDRFDEADESRRNRPLVEVFDEDDLGEDE